jgi:hypothetical protein
MTVKKRTLRGRFYVYMCEVNERQRKGSMIMTVKKMTLKGRFYDYTCEEN